MINWMWLMICTACLFVKGKAYHAWFCWQLREGRYAFLSVLLPLLQQKMPLAEALNQLTQKSFGRLHVQIARHILSAMQSGHRFCIALQHLPVPMDHLVFSLIQLGESQGALVETLSHLITHQKTQSQLSRQLRRAMCYPVFLLVALCGLFGFFTVVLAPRFRALYREMDHGLPRLTQWVFDVSDQLPEMLFQYSGVLLLLLFIMFGLKYYRSGVYAQYLRAWVPYFGRYHYRRLRYGVTYQTWLMFKSGLDYGTVLSRSVNLQSYPYFHVHFRQIQSVMLRGSHFTEALSQSCIYDALMSAQLLTVQSREALCMFLQQAMQADQVILEDYYKRLPGIVQAIGLLTVGLLVGLMIVALYLPVFNLSNAF